MIFCLNLSRKKKTLFHRIALGDYLRTSHLLFSLGVRARPLSAKIADMRRRAASLAFKRGSVE